LSFQQTPLIDAVTDDINTIADWLSRRSRRAAASWLQRSSQQSRIRPRLQTLIFQPYCQASLFIIAGTQAALLSQLATEWRLNTVTTHFSHQIISLNNVRIIAEIISLNIRNTQYQNNNRNTESYQVEYQFIM